VIHLSRPVRCRLDELPDYVSGQLAPQRVDAWDRHLIACVGCQHAVAGERRLQSLLASGCPSMPGSLHAQLVALASSTTGPAPVRTGERAPLEMVPPSAPPAHRSPLRSAAMATAAAGATAAVAWSLTVTGSGALATSVTSVGGSTPSVRPAVGSPSGPTGTIGPRVVSTGWTSSTSVRDLVLCEAESRT
jgi:anti-sigma factor RsiW